MSVRIYTSPGNTAFPRQTVLRQYVPGRVSRQVRYTRSLSAPLDLDKDFTYAPWENSRGNFTSFLLETKPKDFANPVQLDRKRNDFINNSLETKQRELTKPFLETKRRNFINSLWEHVPIPLSESKRKDFYSKPLEIRHREITVPLSETNRRDFTNSLPRNNRKQLTKSYLESRLKSFAENRLEDSQRDIAKSYLGIKHRNLGDNHLENNERNLSDNSLESKRKDLGNNSENSRRDLSKAISEAKGKDLSNNHHLETKSRTLIETPRAIRWWNKQKNLCTPCDLLAIILEPTGQYELPTDPCNEVYPGILLSDGPTALCTSMLKRMGVSHVLNAAQGKERPGQVNTSSSFYTHSRIRFLGVEAFDHIAFRLYPYFDEASDFIQEALDSGGKVLVHCRAGISRSATLVCAFLMLKRHLSAQEAIRTVRKNRPIIPNDGFLQQLCDLNERLHKARGP